MSANNEQRKEDMVARLQKKQKKKPYHDIKRMIKYSINTDDF